MADDATVMTQDAPAAAAAPPATSWRDSLPDDLKADKSLESFKDIPSLAKSYVETKKLVGQKALAVPGENATPEERKAFYRAIGVPESPAEYKLKAHEMMAHPEWNRAAQDEFLKHAHANGFTPAQADAAVQFYANFIGSQIKDNTKLETEAKVDLRNEWGVNYDVMLGAANRGISRVEHAAGLEPGALVEATKGSDPAAIAKAFAWIEQQFVEHGFVSGEPVGGVSGADASAKIQELRQQLLKLPEGSDQAKQIIDQIMAYGRAMGRAA